MRGSCVKLYSLEKEKDDLIRQNKGKQMKEQVLNITCNAKILANMLYQAHINCLIIQLQIKILSEGVMITNFISKCLKFIQLLICKTSSGLFLLKRNEKKNRKGTLTPKMPFAARFSCCATIDFSSILKYFPRGYDDIFYIKIFGIYPTIDL